MFKRILPSLFQRGRTTLPAAVVILAILAGSVAEAQIGRRIRDAARRSAERETARQVDRTITNAIRCAVGEYECYRRAKAEGQEVVFVDADGNIVTDAEGRPVTDYESLPPELRKNPGGSAIQAGGNHLYRAITEEGRAIVRGIHFEAGSVEIRSESTEALDEIVLMLREHPDLRIRIEVHTDGAGDAEVNRDLSDRRAASLRRILTDDYGVAASRLEAEGLGGDRPLDDNDTAEGRQNNRRVELARL